MNRPLEKIMAAAAEHAAEGIEITYAQCKGTEIEKLFYAALRHVIYDVRFWENIYNHGDIEIRQQSSIGEYRVDFEILVMDSRADKYHYLVVECDGHDFHERTKEQAAKDHARDRSLTLDGYTVFRFTGSEIWADPVKCAHQVADWAWEATTRAVA